MKSKFKQTIAICCLTDSSKGFGNFNRSVTLAESIRERGYKIFFIINHNNSVIQDLKSRKFSYMSISIYDLIHNHSKKIFEILESNNCQNIILDMREYNERISKNLMNDTFKVILLDDAWCKKAYADLIFNGTMVKQYHKYKKINKLSKIFVGSKYWIINKEFIKHKKPLNDIYDKPNYNIVISVGGADPNEISLFLVKALHKISNIKITIIIGPFFNNISKLNKFVRNKKNIKLKYSPKNIWTEFLKADLVISGGGNTMFELAAQRIPTMCISTIEHQIPYAKIFAKKGFTVNLGFWKNITPELLNNSLIDILNDKSKRKKMSIMGNQILDGKEMSRVIQIIEKNIF